LKDLLPRSLRTLALSAQVNNALGPEGAKVLAGALEKMTSMQTLNLVSQRQGWCGEGRQNTRLG
jgi:hypothetical protein